MIEIRGLLPTGLMPEISFDGIKVLLPTWSVFRNTLCIGCTINSCMLVNAQLSGASDVTQQFKLPPATKTS